MISERSIRRVLQRFALSPTLQGSSAGADGMQVLLDASASMASGDGSKEQRARELAMTLLRLSAISSRHGTLWVVRSLDRDRVIGAADADRLAHLPFDGTISLAQAWPADLPTINGLRFVISDFLFPADSNELVQRAAAGADKLCLVQLLDPWEAEPEPAGRTALIDAESADVIELSLDVATINRYTKRLSELKVCYAQSCTAADAVWVSTSAAAPLEEICRDQLVPLGLLCDTE